MENTHHLKFPYIVFLSGASGSGKTSLVTQLSREFSPSTTTCLHFDSIGVPSQEEIIQQYGSGKAWQEAKTYEWVKKLINDYTDKKLIIFEGQVDLSFVVSAFAREHFDHYCIFLVHCDDTVRHQRLREKRQQPELINYDMDNWSRYLKEQAVTLDKEILDTTDQTLEECVSWIKQRLA